MILDLREASPAAQPADGYGGADVDHWYCCDPDAAYYGLDLSGVPEGPEFAEICPLCRLVEHEPCPKCGAR